LITGLDSIFTLFWLEEYCLTNWRKREVFPTSLLPIIVIIFISRNHSNIFFNGNITTGFNSPQKLLNDLSQIKAVSKSDLKSFLTQDHTSFSVLSVSTKHIESTNRISITLSKNSARSFYLDQKKSPPTQFQLQPNQLLDDCLKDAQHCQYFQFFSSKEKKLYTRFKDKVEANFEGTQADQPILFLTLTFNTTHDNYSAFTTN
jgi:hypothetical protein